MATKKQKHAAAMEKRERELAELKRTGLEAQRKDRDRIKRRRNEIKDAIEENVEKDRKAQAVITTQQIHKEN